MSDILRIRLICFLCHLKHIYFSSAVFTIFLKHPIVGNYNYKAFSSFIETSSVYDIIDTHMVFQ